MNKHIVSLMFLVVCSVSLLVGCNSNDNLDPTEVAWNSLTKNEQEKVISKTSAIEKKVKVNKTEFELIDSSYENKNVTSVNFRLTDNDLKEYVILVDNNKNKVIGRKIK